MTYRVKLNTPKRRDLAKGIIDRAPENAVATIAAARRSVEQNDKMWAMLAEVAAAKPQGRQHTPDQWKFIFMRSLGHEVEFLLDLDGNPFPYSLKSSRLTVGQMSDLIELIQAYAAQNDVELSQ